MMAMAVLRSINAVVLGWAVTVVLIVAATMLGNLAFGGPATAGGYLAYRIATTFAAAFAGGIAAAGMAPTAPLLHAAALALIVTVVFLFQSRQDGPAWYPPAILAVGIAGFLAGALLWRRRVAA